MSLNTIIPRGADTSRRGSPSIWGDCPWDELNDPRSNRQGIRFYDDFSDLPLQGTLTTQIAAGRYKVFGDTGNTITRVMSINSALVQGGALQLAIDTDNDEVAIAQAYPSFLLSGLTTSGKLWFECSYAQNSVATNMASGFLGLANVAGITLSTTVPLNDGDPISNTMYGVGFRIAEDGLGVVDTVTTDGATSFTNVGASEAGTLVAYTFRKFGIRYDPFDVTRCVRFFADGTELATAITRAALVAFTNIDANGLGLLAAFTADSAGTSFNSYLKWWRVAQEIP